VLVNPIGEPVRPEAYSDRFAVLCRQAGVSTVGLRDVRHTLATIMHRAGLAPSDAAALLGHTVAVHLATYVTPTQKGARAAASGLGAAISEAVQHNKGCSQQRLLTVKFRYPLDTLVPVPP
jgi:integrase